MRRDTWTVLRCLRLFRTICGLWIRGFIPMIARLHSTKFSDQAAAVMMFTERKADNFIFHCNLCCSPRCRRRRPPWIPHLTSHLLNDGYALAPQILGVAHI
jgi:hypothetical protein